MKEHLGKIWSHLITVATCAARIKIFRIMISSSLSLLFNDQKEMIRMMLSCSIFQQLSLHFTTQRRCWSLWRQTHESWDTWNYSNSKMSSELNRNFTFKWIPQPSRLSLTAQQQMFMHKIWFSCVSNPSQKKYFLSGFHDGVEYEIINLQSLQPLSRVFARDFNFQMAERLKFYSTIHFVCDMSRSLHTVDPNSRKIHYVIFRRCSVGCSVCFLSHIYIYVNMNKDSRQKAAKKREHKKKKIISISKL